MTVARYWRGTNESSIPWRLRSSKMCPRQGLSTMGTIGLGRFIVSGRRRPPPPPAMTPACISASLVGGHAPTEDTSAGRPERRRVGQGKQDQSGERPDKGERRKVERRAPTQRLDRRHAEGVRVPRDRHDDDLQPPGLRKWAALEDQRENAEYLESVQCDR